MSPLLIGIIFLLLLYRIYEYVTRVPPNLPPCLPRLPIVGSYWHLLWHNYKHPAKALPYYTKKLKSGLVTCYMGSFLTIIANDYDSIKEVLTREEFDGREAGIDILLERSFREKLGIFFTEGKLWQKQRRFALRHMRDFGFGRRHGKFEANSMENVVLLIKMLKEGPINKEEETYLRNGCALFPDILYPYAANNVWDIMFGERLDRSEHHKLRYICKSAMLFQRSGDTTGGAIVQFWYLKYFGNMFGYKNFIKGSCRLRDFIEEHVDNRQYSGNSDYDRGLVDRYLKELEATKDTFSKKQLLMTLLDFMFPALSAMPSAILHTIKLVMHHPKVMKNVQAEIDSVVGTGRLVTWDDRQNLPYTEATLRESLRYETLTPFSVFHKTLKETTIRGFTIPSNTLVVTNLAGMHNDPDFWGDPKKFKPERFLNEDGQLCKDYSLPFGLGHRVCAGETFARYTLFEGFAALMQNFNFSFVEGEPTGLEDKLPGLIVTPKETWIRVEPRYT
ncbi:probable cytochrome P450 304a1 [Ceratina calcarata]|uniref:Probable cytochrome P450 304a1 n=1 Tax=Ceratina calcarata TaxID=156304 RepID=A0AAJ7J6W6_9HYME|nr:probable cytochrome P450 304a1 [Ceratina calcarata]